MNDIKREKVIQTVRKLFSLAGNNPSENEAIASALKAQQLMAKYNIEDIEIADEIKEEPIENIICDVGTGKKWKYQLGSLVAKNFRCKCWYKGKWGINFYGHKTDIQIAEQVFWYLFKTGDKLANKYVRKQKEDYKGGYYYSTKGCYNSFVAGFLSGIDQKLAKQSKALMIVLPPDVEENYETFSQGFREMNTTLSVPTLDQTAYNEGITQGRNTMNARELGRSR